MAGWRQERRQGGKGMKDVLGFSRILEKSTLQEKIQVKNIFFFEMNTKYPQAMKLKGNSFCPQLLFSHQIQ